MKKWTDMPPWKGILLSLFAAFVFGIGWAAIGTFFAPTIEKLVPRNWLIKGWMYGPPVLAIATTIFIAVVAPSVRWWTVLSIPLVIFISVLTQVFFALAFCLNFTDKPYCK